MDKQALVEKIKSNFKQRFRVIDNTGKDKKAVDGTFPDVILMRPIPPKNDDILFIMKIENGENMIDSVAEWRIMSNSRAVPYVVVPEEKLNEAKTLANAANVRIRFASFSYKKGGDLESIRYE
ncbi:hypothetical protein IJG76_01155 [Candidatus Saccharibacteria bacterium]|nr:hypothetical protein [Candidatus Saccharibacteria bacterium]